MIQEHSSATGQSSQCAQASNEELCALALAHYDHVSTVAHEWNNQIPQAIKAWYAAKAATPSELVLQLQEPRLGVHEDGTEELKTWEQLFKQCQDAARALSTLPSATRLTIPGCMAKRWEVSGAGNVVSMYFDTVANMEAFLASQRGEPE